jgi:AraC-like DNA-binding protein
MTLAAFLPSHSAKHIGSPPLREKLVLAQSWAQLDLILQNRISAVIVDPSADGSMRLDLATCLLRKHAGVPMLAYVSLNGPNMKAVAQLSGMGLSNALLHPTDRRVFWEVVQRTLATRLVSDFLRFIGVPRAKLPGPIAQAVEDVFERPNRYETAADIALQSSSTPRRIYRRFEAAHLGRPKKVLTAARLIRAYTYLRVSSHNVLRIAEQLGYADSRVFAAHIRTVFGCCPSSLRSVSNENDVLMHLLDWFYRPSKSASLDYLAKAPSKILGEGAVQL